MYFSSFFLSPNAMSFQVEEGSNVNGGDNGAAVEQQPDQGEYTRRKNSHRGMC